MIFSVQICSFFYFAFGLDGIAVVVFGIAHSSYTVPRSLLFSFLCFCWFVVWNYFSVFFFCENEKIKLKFNQRRSWDHYTFFVWPLGIAIHWTNYMLQFWALAQLNLLKSFLQQMNDLSFFFFNSLDAFDSFFSFNKWNCELVIRLKIYFLWIGMISQKIIIW